MTTRLRHVLSLAAPCDTGHSTPESSRMSGEAFDRRRFLRSALALGALGSSRYAIGAPTAGRVLLGFQLPASQERILDAILAGLQGRYQPDLGRKPVLLLGESGRLSVDAALRAPADGATALVAPSSFVALLPEVRRIADDPVSRIMPVAGIGESTIAFIVGPRVPRSVLTMADYFAWARNNPMMASYAVPGLGTSLHFVGREVMRSADMTLKEVNYRGLQPIFEDVVSGQIAAAFTIVPEADVATRFPMVRILAVASDQRWPTCPDVPTLMELRLMPAPIVESLGFFFADGTPAAKVEELAAAVRAVTATPDIMKAMTGILRPMSDPSKPYAQVLADERKMWINLARRVEA